jgi:hypothetical protein
LVFVSNTWAGRSQLVTSLASVLAPRVLDSVRSWAA